MHVGVVNPDLLKEILWHNCYGLNYLYENVISLRPLENIFPEYVERCKYKEKNFYIN